MATKNPLKYENAQHLPFEPGDTVPREVLDIDNILNQYFNDNLLQYLSNLLIAGNGITITPGPGGTLIITNTCCDDGTCIPSWVPTGSTRCVGPLVEREEQDGCGNTRWVDTGAGPVWTPTGNTRCVGATVEREELDSCGAQRWVDTGTPIVWTETGLNRCIGATVELEESSSCGSNRWVPTGIPVAWTATGVTRCVADFLENEEISYCGSRRWTPTLTPCVVPEDSVHTVAVINVAPTEGFEGTIFCWTVNLDIPVAGQPLVLSATFSGTEQDAVNYPNQTITMDIGRTTGTFCLQTVNDPAVDGPTELCLTLLPNVRVSNILPAVCVDIFDDESTAGFGDGLFGGGCYTVEGVGSNLVQYFIRFESDGQLTEGSSLAPATTGNRGRWTSESTTDRFEILSGTTVADGLTSGQYYSLPRTLTWSLAASGGATAQRYVTPRLTLRRISDQQEVASLVGEVIYLGVNRECP